MTGTAETVASGVVVARPVFTADGVDYTWGDAVVAARLRGDWEPVEQAARRGLAALTELHRRGETIDAADAAGAGNAFRYERNLLAGDELEAWLARWDLSLIEWGEWVSSTVARERLAGSLEGLVEERAPERDEVERAAAVEAICSGALERWAGELAGRAAAALARGRYAEASPPGEPPPARGALAIEPARWAAAAAKVAPLDRPLGDMVGEVALASEVARHRLEWLSFSCRRLVVPDAAGAREALCCMREDGLTLEQAADLARGRVEDQHLVLEDAADGVEPLLLGAREGEVIGPLEDERGGFALLAVDRKRPPDVSDPEIAARAHRRALERALGREVDARVRWHEHV